MKKLITLLLACLTLLLFSLSGCSKNIDFTDKISQLRTEIYCGKTDNLEIYGYLEQRESPLCCDGKTDSLKKYLILKINNNQTLSGENKAKIILDKEYDIQFDFKAERDCFVAVLEISAIPEKEFSVIFNSDSDTPLTVKLNLITPTDIISYKKALTFCEKYAKELLKTYQTDMTNYEVHIRLLNIDNHYYWYIAFCDKDYTHAYLIDATNGNQLSQKDIKNN